MEFMFNKVLFYSLAAALLLSNSGMQLMACVAAPQHQACQHRTCKHSHSEPGRSHQAPKDHAEPLACLQACGASMVSLHPEVQVGMVLPLATLADLPNPTHVFLPSSEPRSIFHPPA